MKQQLAEFKDIVPMIHLFSGILKGTNILFDFGNSLKLLKYEGNSLEVMEPNTFSYSRHVTLMTFPKSFFDNKKTNEEKSLPAKQEKNLLKKLQANILGTHMLDFNLDEEFGIWLPSSYGKDLFLTIAGKYKDGVEKMDNLPIITIDPSLVEKRLKEVTRPDYYENVIVPFLENKSTKFKIPKEEQPWHNKFFQTKKDYVRRRITELPNELKHGDFLYVGCKEEVFLQGFVEMNNEYTNRKDNWYCGVSTKPILYFSNNYLEFISKHDAEMPKHEGEGSVNVANYRTYDIPEMGGKRFIFPQIGRNTDCKNGLFTGYPELITGNLDEALKHFAKTDFAEFSDVVERYAKNMSFIHPSLEYVKNGSRYFC